MNKEQYEVAPVSEAPTEEGYYYTRGTEMVAYWHKDRYPSTNGWDAVGLTGWLRPVEQVEGVSEKYRALRYEVTKLLAWLKEHRPNVPGLGAPIQMIKDLMIEREFIAPPQPSERQGKVKDTGRPSFSLWDKEALSLLQQSVRGLDVLTTMCEKVKLSEGAQRAKEISENIYHFLHHSTPPTDNREAQGADREIVESILKDVWDKSAWHNIDHEQHEGAFYKSKYPDQQTTITNALKQLGYDNN